MLLLSRLQQQMVGRGVCYVPAYAARKEAAQLVEGITILDAGGI
jgi:hypothetical protein